MDAFFSDGRITIFHGDSLEGFRWVIGDPNIKIALVTDPPFGYNYVSNMTKEGSANHRFNEKPIANDDSTEARDAIIAMCEEDERDIPMIVFGSWKAPRPENIRNRLIWDKGDSPGMGDLKLPWGFSDEEIYILGQGFEGKRTGSVLRHQNIPPGYAAGREHPNQKPVGLMRELIEKIPDDYAIIDPFMGSGSTLVAAKELGRTAIGFELEESYCQVAADRLAQEVLF